MGQNASTTSMGVPFKDDTKRMPRLTMSGSKLTTFRRKLHARCTRIMHVATHHASSAHRHLYSAHSSSSASSSASISGSASCSSSSAAPNQASLEQRHAMRDLLTSWTLAEIESLVSLYTDTAMLAELSRDSDLARPHCKALKEDLSVLFDEKLCTDVDIIYKDMSFSVHRVILSLRCPYLASILARNPRKQIHLSNEEVFDIDVNIFSLLLKYLYVGDTHFTQFSMQGDVCRVVDKFNVPNSLEIDVARLLDDAEQTGDVLLTFAGGSTTIASTSTPTTDHSAPCDQPITATPASPPHPGIRCHRVILAARSPFFRALIERRLRDGAASSGGDGEVTSEGATIEIELDEAIISRRYAHSLIYAMYTDRIDVSLIHESPSLKNLRDVQAMVSAAATSSSYYTGTSALSVVLTDLYHIGEFLNIPRICQECEDELDATLNLDNISATLTWSLESYGSNWLRRQCLDFCRQNFLKLCQSSALYDLSHDSFIEIISSDNVQASECDILAAIMKWSEHQLMKRFDSRDFKLSSSAYKPRHLCESDQHLLKRIAKNLLRELRPTFLLPIRNSRSCNYDCYQVALHFGLVTNGNVSITTAERWLHGDTPRLFSRHINEAKMALRDKYVATEVSRPDTLYMLDKRNSPLLRQYQAVSNRSLYYDERKSHETFELTNEVNLPYSYPLLTRETHATMKVRQQTLLQCSLCRNAIRMGDVQASIAIEYVNLQVVREFGYNDSLAYQMFSKQWRTMTLKSTNVRYRGVNNLLQSSSSSSNRNSPKPRDMPDIAVETLEEI